ncbi:MAG: glucose 1-dehydrogenase [Oscillospiraceae bacterium]|nr:glucose 1-dehydrogenase [Oscillospiraceae bacterium]
MEKQGSTAIVTGASRGIGRAVAERLARAGWRVCVNYRVRRDCAEELCARLTGEGLEAMAFQADVSDRRAVESMVRAARERFGPVGLLVSNAGIAGQMQIQDVTDGDWERYFAVNVKGAFHTIQAVLPDMLHAHRGSIVTVSSMWGLRGASCEAVYSATKAALIGLTRSLALELAPSGIRVNCVAPGVVDTDMVRVLGQETLDALAEQTPLGRLGTPEDIAAAVAFLVGEEAGFVTGQVLTADGGFVV